MDHRAIKHTHAPSSSIREQALKAFGGGQQNKPKIIVISSRAPDERGSGAGGAMGATNAWLKRLGHQLQLQREMLEKRITKNLATKRKGSQKRLDRLRLQLRSTPNETDLLKSLKWYGIKNNAEIRGDFDQAAANDGVYPLAGSLSVEVTNLKLNLNQYRIYYAEVANQLLWPASHLISKAVIEINDAQMGHIYDVMKQLAISLKCDIKPGNSLHINDYQNILLAEKLREQGIDNTIVYFHHIPVPSVQETIGVCGESVARRMAEFYKSLIHCDTVNFQTPNDAKNFMDFLAYAYPDAHIRPHNFGIYKTIAVNINGRSLRIGNTPIGVDPEQVIAERDNNKPLSANAQRLVDQLTAKTIFFSVERLDYTKGILDRVIAFKKLLEQNPKYIGEMQMVMGAQPSREDIEAYKEYKEQVLPLIDEINDKYGQGNFSPIILLNETIQHEDAMKIMASSQTGENGEVIRRIITLVTAPKDGMNLVALESACVQKAGSAGIVLLSSGAGAAQILRGNEDGGEGAVIYDASKLTYNGWHLTNPEIIVDAMIKGAEMQQGEAEAMAKRGRAMAAAYSNKRWGEAQRFGLLRRPKRKPSPLVGVVTKVAPTV